MKNYLTLIFSLFVFISFAQTQAEKIKKEKDEKFAQIRAKAGQEIIKINETFYVLRPLGIVAGNLVIFITEEGLVMVDDQWEIVEELITEKIQQFWCSLALSHIPVCDVTLGPRRWNVAKTPKCSKT